MPSLLCLGILFNHGKVLEGGLQQPLFQSLFQIFNPLVVENQLQETVEPDIHIGRLRGIQDFFLNEPVLKAWLFGSFSRMEERPDSDIDILVDLDHSSPIGLLQYAGMANALESKLGRKVDLVAEGSIKPFARESVEQDKVLVYERA